MEFVAILAGVAVFCILYPISGSYRRYEAAKELKKKLKALSFETSAEFSAEGADIYVDEKAGLWFVRTNLESSTPNMRTASEISYLELRESGNIIAEVVAGRPCRTPLFSDNSIRLPKNGRCTDFFLRIKTSGDHGDDIIISLLSSNALRSSNEYKNALARARDIVRVFSALAGSEIISQ